MSRRALLQSRPWLVVVMFLACFTLAYVDRNITGVLVEPLKASLHLSDTQIGFIQGFAFSLCFALAGPPIAWLIDRGPRMRIATVAVAAWSVATTVCGLAGSFSTVVTGRAMTAIAEAALPPSVYSMITDMFPRNQVARATALFLAAPSFGLGIAWFCGGRLLALFNNSGGLNLPLIGHLSAWQAVFVSVGVPGVMFAAMLALLPEPLRREAAAGSPSAQPLASLAQVLKPQAGVIVPYVLGTASLMSAFFAHAAWGISVLARNHGLPPHQGAQLMGLLTFASGSAAAVLSGWLAGRGSEAGTLARVLRIMIGSAALMICAALALPFVGAGAAAVCVFGVFLFASTAGIVLLAVPVQLSFPGHLRARAITVIGLFYAIGSAGIGPWLVGWVSDQVFHNEAKLGVALATVSVLAALLGLVLLHLSLRRLQSRPSVYYRGLMSN